MSTPFIEYKRKEQLTLASLGCLDSSTSSSVFSLGLRSVRPLIAASLRGPMYPLSSFPRSSRTLPEGGSGDVGKFGVFDFLMGMWRLSLPAISESWALEVEGLGLGCGLVLEVDGMSVGLGDGKGSREALDTGSASAEAV